MAADDWDWRHPAELQDVSWDCAAASTAWALQAAGLAYSEADVIEGLGQTRISPALGLLDASGAGIVDWLASIGVSAENNPSCSWDDIETAAGFKPMLMGGRNWNHWTGLRMAGSCFDGVPRGVVLLANPSPGWMAIQQWMDVASFGQLGAFSAVWFTAW